MPRLPQPGSDTNTWGDILNEYLSVEHNPDGSQKPLPQSKITNLTTDLASKVDTTDPRVTADQAPGIASIRTLGYGTNQAAQGSAVDARLGVVESSEAGKIPSSLVDAKGDLIVATANDTVARVAAGSDGQMLSADSTALAGIKWVANPSTSLLASNNIWTGTNTYRANLYQQDSGGRPLVTLAPTSTGAGTYAGQVLLHGAASNEVNKRLWYWAVDVSAAIPYRDSVWGKILDNGNASDVDGIYISHGGTSPATIGIGIAQPAAYGTYFRAKIMGSDIAAVPTGGTLQIMHGVGSPTGPLLAVTGTSGVHRYVIDPTNSNTWAHRVRGDASVSNPVYVVEDIQAGFKEQMRITANGRIQFADGSTGTTDSNTAISRSAAGIVNIAQNFAVGNTMIVGPGAAAGTTPTAQLDVVTSGSQLSSLYIRNTTQGSLQLMMAGTGNEARIYTSNASAIKIGPSGTPRITISGSGNISFQSANKPTLPADATDLATAITLVNALKSMAQLYTMTA